MRRALALLVLPLAACTTSDDPLEGGLVNAIAGTVGGGYQARIDERERGVAQAQARQDALSAELLALRGEYAALQARIAAQRRAIASRGVDLPRSVNIRTERALAPPPNDPAALRQAIASARALSEELERLSGSDCPGPGCPAVETRA